MGSTTTVKSVPYPVGTDPADPRFVYDLAAWADTAFAAYDVSFAAGPRPKAFMIRSTVDTGGASNNNSVNLGSSGGVAIDWDTSGGTISTTSGSWSQSASDAQAWWMFGANLFVAVATGTATAGARLQMQMNLSSYDPLTNLPALNAMGDGASFYNSGNSFSSVLYMTDATETNTGGEWITGYIIVPVYRATIFFGAANFDAGASKKIATGSVAWGIKLGDV